MPRTPIHPVGVGVALTLIVASAGCRRERVPGPAAAPTLAQPTAAATAPDAALPFSLVIDRSGTRLGGASSVLVPLAADPTRGADAAYKRNGPNDLYLVPLGGALEREKSAGRLRVPLRVTVLRSTTYRVLLEALFTAAQHEIGAFELSEEGSASRSFAFEPPRSPRPGTEPPAERLDLVALIVGEGIAIKAKGGNLAPGCEKHGPGLAAPRRARDLDLTAFDACVAKLRAESPALASEAHATITANPDIPFSEVVDVALALRARQFSKLGLGVAK